MIFFAERLRVFFGEVAWFVLWRACMIFFGRLHDFFLWTGCVISFIKRLRDFVFGEVV